MSPRPAAAARSRVGPRPAERADGATALQPFAGVAAHPPGAGLHELLRSRRGAPCSPPLGGGSPECWVGCGPCGPRCASVSCTTSGTRRVRPGDTRTVRRGARADRRARRGRLRRRLVHRAPLRGGRLPAVVDPGGRRRAGPHRSACGWPRTSPCCPSTTRCGWPRTWPCSTTCPEAGSRWAWGWATPPTSSPASASPSSRRVSLTEEALDILRLAWTGEAFSYRGRRYESTACG